MLLFFFFCVFDFVARVLRLLMVGLEDFFEAEMWSEDEITKREKEQKEVGRAKVSAVIQRRG